VLTAALALVPGAYGAGELDPTFDGDGRVTTSFGSSSTANGIAVQADGKIVAAGTTGFPSDFAVARYNPDGSLDPSFDGDGKAVTDFGGNEGATGIAIQADGQIVAAGVSNDNFALARYNPNGTLDTSFDGDGKLVTDFGGSDVARAVAIQADGRIVAAGTSPAFPETNFALARYNPDGSLDSGFDGDGKLVTDFGSYDLANGVAIQGDGKIVVAGGNNDDFALVRYNPDGTLDSGFDGDGKLLTDFGGFELARAIAIQADGKIAAAGWTQGNPTFFYDFALARYNPDGSLDTSFDSDGKVIANPGGADDLAYAVAVQAGGKIVAAGASGDNEEASSTFALARFDPDGSLDPTFGSAGAVFTGFPGPSSAAHAVAIQPDGKIVAAGEASDFALARYLPGPLPAPDSYPRPRGATPILLALVPAYTPCTSPNRDHAGPLAGGSCNPPVQTSDELTTGRDANFEVKGMRGFLRLDVIAGDPSPPGDQADVRLDLSITDVRLADHVSDYTGELQARLLLRITDRDNTPSPAAATTQDTPFPFTVPCTATSDTAVGSSCAVITTADAVLSGAVKEQKRTIWQLGQFELYDGGSDGVATTTADNTLFATQGIFTP
jgi:uncharacterized delta-60 repeat protein